MVLVDASVWVDVLRDSSKRCAAVLKELVGERELVFTRPTQLELLQGARGEQEWELLSVYLESQEYIEPLPSTWKDAARIYFDLRRQGKSVRSMIDCLIAQLAIDSNALLLHRDSDFELIGSIRPLQQIRVEWDRP